MRLRAMLRSAPWAAMAVLAAGAGVAGCSRSRAAAPPAAAPPAVEVAPVVQRDVPIYGNWIATLHGYVNAQIQPHVTGYLIRQEYQEGAFVPRDAVLFAIDPRPFQAVLDQSQAQLAAARAQLGNAALDVKRDVPEAAAHAIPQSQLDHDTQAKLAAEAGVEAAQAAVEQARLNLNYCQVRSLVGGIAGLAQVQVGNLVSPTTVLTSVSQVNPIKVYFPITGQEYLAIAARINAGTVNLLSRRDPIPLQLTLSNGKVYRYTGRILFADRQLDPQTGTINIVGEFPNPERILRPGQTGRIRAMTEIEHGALLVPQRAVSQLQGGYQVEVVGADNRVSLRSVQVGPQVESRWVVTHGLKPGERVIAEGGDQVRDGMVVSPAPYHTPDPAPGTPTL